MKQIPEELFNKIKKLSDEVKRDLRRKGLVTPVKNNDGTTSIGHYTIIRDLAGYSILDFADEVLIDRINLPQTAIVVANKLALGQYKDSELLLADKNYGFADFEETLYKRAIEKYSSDKFDIYLSKYISAHDKKVSYKREVIKTFEKLIKLV
jgi:hypothetical protein